MKLNLDCVRDVMLYLEDRLVMGDFFTAIQIDLPHYDKTDIIYTVSKLGEAGYLNIKQHSTSEGINFFISSISWDGHHFLDTVRPQTVWATTKSVAQEIGVFTLNGIFQIGSQVITQLISRSLGF